MRCKYCHKNLPENAVYCCFCGKPLSGQKDSKPRRSNGTGYIFKRGRYYYIQATLGYDTKPNGKMFRKTRTKGGFKTKREAELYLPYLLASAPTVSSSISFKGLYEEWLPTHEAKVTSATLACYKAAFKYYENLWYTRFTDIKTKALQEQIDACPRGVRTKENMKALGTLLYTYAVQNDLVDKNYASFIYIDRSVPQKRRGFFTLEERKTLWKNVGAVPNTEFVLCLMYTGLRPNEFLKLKITDYYGDYIVGGSKTEKGMNRVVTLSPKIQPFVSAFAERNEEYLFSFSGKKMSIDKFREIYYEVLSACGLEKKEPYCCRHTFASMMSETSGTDAAKTELMGHTNIKMTNYYTHTELANLKQVTDQLV